MADQPVRSGAQTTSAAAGPLSPVPGWVGMARALLLRACPSLHPLPTLLCAAFCTPEAVVSGLLPIARDQRILIPVGALRLMLLAIACLGHRQQRPGSDMPQLLAGVLQWVTSPGILAVEVLEVKSHLVWTHQTTDDPGQLLGPRSPLSVRHAYTLLTQSRRMARRQVHRRFVVQALPTQCSHSGAGGRGCQHFRRLLWSVVAGPMGEWLQGGLLTLGCQWREGGWCIPTLFLSPMHLWCCGLRCSWGLRTVAAACLLGVCDHSGCPHSGAARFGGRGGLLQLWHLWLVDPPL
jgi:hypothetical protein